jgi:flagellar biosynthesis protein FlhF
MQQRKFLAGSLPQAMAAVREELGRDAMIVSTKKVRLGGILGFFGRPLVQVMAQAAEGERALAAYGRWAARGEVAVAARGEVAVAARGEVAVAARGGGGGGGNGGGGGAAWPAAARAPEAPRVVALRRAVSEMYGLLLRQDMGTDLAREIAARAARTLQALPGEGRGGNDDDDGGGEGAWRRAVAATLCNALPPCRPTRAGAGRVVVALVGPAGAGKTLTAAKLAARFALVEKRRVVLLTVDTRRVAALDQLKAHASIIGVPAAACYSPDELALALDECAGAGAVIIDTPGRSVRDARHAAELAEFMAAARPDETHLVLSLAMRRDDALAASRHLAAAAPNRLTLTHADDAAAFGAAFAVALEAGLCPAFLGTGQRVPEDLEEATAAGLADYVLGRDGPEWPAGR